MRAKSNDDDSTIDSKIYWIFKLIWGIRFNKTSLWFIFVQVALETGKLKSGDHVALLYPPGLDLIAAVYGCFYIGLIPVPIRPPNPNNMLTTLPTVRMIVQVSKSVAILTSTQLIKMLRSRDAQQIIDPKVLHISLSLSLSLSSLDILHSALRLPPPLPYTCLKP